MDPIDPYEKCLVCERWHYTHNADINAPPDHEFVVRNVADTLSADFRGDLRLLADSMIKHPKKIDVFIRVFREHCESAEIQIDDQFKHFLGALESSVKRFIKR